MSVKDYRIRLFYSLSRIVRFFRRLKLAGGGYNNISKTVIIERGVVLDKVNPSGIHIGEYSFIASGSIILSHDHVRRRDDGSYWMADTYIGKNVFIGLRSIVLPGVSIGDECCIGAGSVVTKDIPSNCIAAGVPAQIIKTGIRMKRGGAIIPGDAK